MTAPFHHPLDVPVSPIKQAEAAIGRLIVASASFETQLTLLLRVLDPDASPLLLPSQKIKAIRLAVLTKGAAGLPQRQQGRISIIVQEADKLLALRRECAHSCVTPLVIDGEQHWLLRNAQTAGDPLDRCVLVSASQMTTTAARLRQLTHQLNQILNPPLPRPPEPDATTGP